MRVEVNGLAVALGGEPILHGIDLEADPGELVSVVGPNGSGKSTLLRCVYRVLQPDQGSVTTAGRDVWTSSQRSVAQSTAVLVQEPQGEFDFAVFDMVLMGRTPHMGLFERTGAADEQLARAALETVDAAHLGGRRFRSLSGGEKQRVLLARAITQQPRVLILDEPTNHLDIHHQLEILEMVRTLGVTTIAALHDLNLAARYSDRVYVLDAGRVVAHGTPAEVFTAALISEVFRVGVQRWDDPATGIPQLSFRPRAKPAGPRPDA